MQELLPWLPWAGGYVGIGIISASACFMSIWRTQDMKDYLAKHGYERATEQVKSVTLQYFFIWPLMWAVSLFLLGWSLLQRTNPHIAHLRDWDETKKSYHYRVKLEEDTSGDPDGVSKPEPWCSCQLDAPVPELNMYVDTRMVKPTFAMEQYEVQNTALRKEILRLRSQGLS